MGMKVAWPFQVMVDNNQAISFQKDTCIDSKVRGNFDLRDEFVTELRLAGVVVVSKVATEDNYADVLTKCMNSGRFNSVVDKVQGEGELTPG